MDINARLLPFPALETLPVEVFREGARLGEQYSQADQICMKRVAHWANLEARQRLESGLFTKDELAHRLSPFVAPNKTEVKDDSRTLLEFSMLKNCNLPEVSTLSAENPSAFMEFCLWLHTNLDGREHDFRTQAVTTLPDRIGAKIIYPNAESIKSSLEEVAVTWSRITKANVGLGAAYALVALMTVHPFLDGNGRLARVFFNWNLNGSRRCKIYLPIYEVSAISDCGYILRVRQAQYHNNWYPLLSYLNFLAERFFLPQQVQELPAPS